MLQGARSVGGRHVGIFWTLTGLLIFLWCACMPHLVRSLHAAWQFWHCYCCSAHASFVLQCPHCSACQMRTTAADVFGTPDHAV